MTNKPKPKPKSMTSTTIRVSPFRLTVKPIKEGFVCEFSGVDSEGRKIELELEFPAWWVGEIVNKLATIKRK